MLSGDNGILQKAIDAKEQTSNSQIQEQINLAYHSSLVGGQGEVTDTSLENELKKEFNKTILEEGWLDKTSVEGKWRITIDGVYLDVPAGKGDIDNLQEITADTPAGVVVKSPNTWTTLQGKAISDGNGTAIPLPTGFYYVGGDYNTGLVISDKENDNINASGITMGNQFVWIPVANETALTRTSFDSNGNVTTGLNTTNFTEPYASGYSGENNEYDEMCNQVLLYGGFYIGRYEAGVNSTDLRTEETTDQIVVCKKGVAPYDYIPWGASMNDINSTLGVWEYDESTDSLKQSEAVQTHGAVFLSKQMYSDSSSVKSTLIYGSQWDAMCRYIGNSNMTTSTKSAKEITGSVNTDVSKNIYDLAGNCLEWTMEAVGSWARVIRGGRYNEEVPVSIRSYASSNPDNYGYGFGFRISLYIK